MVGDAGSAATVALAVLSERDATDSCACASEGATTNVFVKANAQTSFFTKTPVSGHGS